MGYYADHDRSIQIPVDTLGQAAYMCYHAAGHILDDERKWGSEFFDALGDAYLLLIRQSNETWKYGMEKGEVKPPYKMFSYFVEEKP